MHRLTPTEQQRLLDQNRQMKLLLRGVLTLVQQGKIEGAVATVDRQCGAVAQKQVAGRQAVSLSAASLFSGIGGLDLAAVAAGFDIHSRTTSLIPVRRV